MPRKMKESGVEWLGQIPEGWEIKRFKYVAKSLRKGNGITKDEVLENGDLPCVRYGEIYSKYKFAIERCASKTKKDVVTDPVLISAGDILFACTGELVEEIGKNILYKGKETCVAGGDIMVASHNQNPTFLNYYLNCHSSQFQKSRNKTKLKVVHIKTSDIENLLVLIPTLPEQERIAAFLDERCAKIDGMIAEAKASIEDYKKWKQSIIFEAVTGKHEKNLKPSGIKWVGNIPDGWGMAKASVVFSTITDYVASGSFADLAKNVQYKDVPDYARLIRTADVSGKAGSLAPIYIDKKAYNFLSNSNLFGGEIMLPNIGASVGDAYLIPNLYEHMSLAPNSIMLRTKYEQKYYYYYFLSGAGRKSLEDIAESTAQPKFNKTDFRNLRLPLPPVETQRRIAAELDEKCAAIDKLVGEKEALIADLEAYKKSLIFETVTGKREVA